MADDFTRSFLVPRLRSLQNLVTSQKLADAVFNGLVGFKYPYSPVPC